MKRSGKRRGSAVLIRFMLMIMGLFAGNFLGQFPHLRRSRGSRAGSMDTGCGEYGS